MDASFDGRTIMVLGLVAALLTMQPILTDDVGAFALSGVSLSLRHLYVATTIPLALGLYIYAFAFLRGEPHPWVARIGDALYVLALFVPSAYAGAYLGKAVVPATLAGARASDVAAIVLGVGGSTALATTLLIALRRRDAAYWALRQRDYLEVAEQALARGNARLATRKAGSAAFTALARRLGRDAPQEKGFLPGLIAEAHRRKVLREDEAKDLFRLRTLRELAATDDITTGEAAEALAIARRICRAPPREADTVRTETLGDTAGIPPTP